MQNGNHKEVVVITGASAGVGRATALAFAKQGAKIGLIARGRERLEMACKEIESVGGKGLVLPMDVYDPSQIERAATMVEDAFGSIDIWINNAMVSILSPFNEMTPEEFKRVTEVTYLGVVYGTMAALRRMAPRNEGCIVQVGSALAYRSIPLQSAYCGAKHGIRGFTDSLRSELIHSQSNIHLTMVQLPALNTPQFSWVKSRLSNHPQPVPPIYQPEFAANAIVWAAHHRRREVFLGYSTVLAILGSKFAAAVADYYLARTGYQSQQTDQPVDPDRPNNLWNPVPGNFSAHGVFDRRAKFNSSQFWIVKQRRWIAWLAGGLIAFVGWFIIR